MSVVKLREKIAYGFGDAASSMFWKLFTTYLLFFYTDVFGIGAAAAGTMLLVTRAWDSFLDPLIGVLGDRTESRWGKFRPYILWVAIPFGIVAVLTFTTPDFSSDGKLVYAYITYSLMMMIYSLINVPYASLLGVISPDPKERTQLSSYRMIFAFIGSIIALLLVEPFVEIFSKMDNPKVPNLEFGWQMAAAVFAVMAVILFFLCFAWTKERVKPISEKKNSLKDDLKDLLQNKPWWILLGAGICTLIFNSIRDGAAVYYFKYYVVETEALYLGLFDVSLTLTTFYLVIGQAANILGILLVPMLSSRLGKKYTYLCAMAFAAFFSLIFYFMTGENVTLIMILQLVISMCAGIVTPLLWSMYADITDYSELKTGRRATGLIFSSSSMSQKLGWSLGGALAGWLLGYFGFKANVEQSHEVLTGIRLMLSVLPALGALLSVAFISFYPLSEKNMEDITLKLNEKRTN